MEKLYVKEIDEKNSLVVCSTIKPVNDDEIMEYVPQAEIDALKEENKMLRKNNERLTRWLQAKA